MRRLLVLLLVGLLPLGNTAPSVVDAQASPSITITKPPAAGETVPEGDDFATTVLGNPWDQTEAIPPDVESTLNVDSVAISGGTWRGVSRNNDPQLTLLSRGYGQNNPCCKGSIHWKPNDGFVNPIDADKYHVVSIRMKLTNSGAASQGQLFWFRTDSPTEPPSFSNFFPTRDGWNTYTFDLRTLGALSGTWNGTIRGLRFDPTTVAGASIEIDWIRLLADSTATTSHTVQWTTANAPAGSLVDLLGSDGTGPVFAIGQNLPVDQGSQTWNSYYVAPGTYTITAQLHTNTVLASATAPLTLNTAPQIQITAPSTSSGPDFATTVLGDAWDFSNPQDFMQVEFSSTTLANGILSGLSTQSGGPDFQLNTRGQQINTAKYHYLTLKYRMDDSNQTLAQQARDHVLKIAEGWAARVIWWGPGGPAVDECTSAWFAVEPYEFVYTTDLATVPIENADPTACGPQGKAWPQSTVTTFRFDPHEVPQPTGWAIDYLKLTGNQETTGSLKIEWTTLEPNTSPNALVDLFYSPVNTGASLIPITTDVPASAGNYTWDTSALPQGASFYVVTRIRDGQNTIQRVSSAPFTVVAAPVGCTPRPNISVQSAASGDGRLRVTLTASGSNNPLQSIRFEQTSGALIDITGGQTGSTGGFTQALPTGATSYTFFLRRAAAGQAATAPFTIVDGCGDWHSFAGGGINASF